MVHPGPEANADAVRVEAHPADPFAGIVCDSALEYAAILQKRYREKRRRYAWSIGRPYSQDQEIPPPWARDLDPLPDEG